MGLDMYLHCNSKELSRDMANHPVNENDNWFVDDEVGYNKRGMIGYWRKANAIHKWFVDNCQNGVDDQRRAFVRTSLLHKLRDACKTVLDTVERDENGKFKSINSEVAAELLPCQDGFFFGSCEYDEWYVADLEHTMNMIDAIFSFCEDDDGWSMVHKDDDSWRVSIYYTCWW